MYIHVYDTYYTSILYIHIPSYAMLDNHIDPGGFVGEAFFREISGAEKQPPIRSDGWSIWSTVS